MNKIGNELILCSQTYDDTSDFRKFGNTLLHRCTIDMTSLRRDIYTTYFKFMQEQERYLEREHPLQIKRR